MNLPAGTPVRASGRDPLGHYRLPRYLRAKAGRIVRANGRFPLADERAAGRSAPLEEIYTVAFDAREVWGPAGEAGGIIYADLTESYLERS
ncbi:MAG: hypothetical protein NVSMB64_24820 [Candidatus Velthaea sp.]